VGELQKGRPVLVLQNLGLNILPVYHYAVVIGVLPNGKIILRSGRDERLVMDIDDFVTTWERTGSWGIVALQPGELPNNPDRLRYLRSVRDFELTGHVKGAGLGYLSAQDFWPGDRSVLFALGNNLLALKEYSKAEDVFLEIVMKDHGDIAALNNLAEALSLQGCDAIALTYVEQGIEIAMKGQSPLLEVLQQTRGEIEERFALPIRLPVCDR
jgi:hypothetical protein